MDGVLTPEMVHDVRFARARHGYRVEDVDGFLMSVADGISALQAETAVLRSRIAELESELPSGRAQHVLVAATSIAERLLADASHEAAVLAAAHQHRVDSTAGALARATEACDKALELVGGLRAELRSAGEAFAPAVEGVAIPEVGSAEASAPSGRAPATAGFAPLSAGIDRPS